MSDDERLRRLLGGPDTTWLVQRVRDRLARREPITGKVVLRAPTPAQRSAVQRLLGRPPSSGASLSVDLAQVDALLRSSGAWPAGLAAAVERLLGPIPDLRTEADLVAGEWRRVFGPLAADPRPQIRAWAAEVQRSGLVRRLTRDVTEAELLVADAARVIAELPAEDEPRGRLAARVAGHAHDLDEGRPLTTVVFSAARVLAGMPEGSGARWRREVWAAVGVLRDDLSSTVIALGLPGTPDTPTGRVLLEWRHEPVVLTLRQVLAPDFGRSLGLVAGDEVFVCENPVVVSMAADRAGPPGPALVCVNGRPGVAADRLLSTLAALGARLRYHGDFDWGGVRIANAVIAATGAIPWRMSVTDYRRAVASGAGRELSGTPVAACWDPDLAPAMATAGRRVEEEHVLDDLLLDLVPAVPPVDARSANSSTVPSPSVGSGRPGREGRRLSRRPGR